MFLQVNLSQQLQPGTLEHAIDQLVEERVKLEWFEGWYANDASGPKAYDPRALLKVVLVGYARGLVSSRKLERACRENIVFMALMGGRRPDHSTFANFVGRLEGQPMHKIFAEILLVCAEEGLLGGTEFALDGLKLPANASKKWSGRVTELEAKRLKLQSRLELKLKEQREQDARKDADEQNDDDDEPPPVKRLRRQIENIERHLKEVGPKPGAKGKEVQGNVTDPDSAKMFPSHGVVQGYNAQALVDAKNQVVTAALADGRGQDYANVAPVMEEARAVARSAGLPDDYYRGAHFSADANYHSETNLEACEREGFDAIIPDPNFRSRDPRYATRERHKEKVRKKKGLFGPEDFEYDDANDCYYCPMGRSLHLQAGESRNSAGVYRRYGIPNDFCEICDLREQCLTKGAKRRTLAVKIATSRPLCEAMRNKIDDPAIKKRYETRAAIVEPVFGNIRFCKRMDRFTLRGRNKVNLQWLLFCLVHNIGKIARSAAKFTAGGPNRSLYRLSASLRTIQNALRKLFSPFGAEPINCAA